MSKTKQKLGLEPEDSPLKNVVTGIELSIISF